jgi:DNA gyrase subunit A
MSVKKISELGRATQGVKLIRVDEGDEIAAITSLDEMEEEIEDSVSGEISTSTEEQPSSGPDEA